MDAMAGPLLDVGEKLLVLGIGNVLLTDEGVGVHALRALEQSNSLPARAGSSKVEFLDGGTLSFAISGAIEECDALIVFDAAEINAPPGGVRVFETDAMDQFLAGSRKRSVHEVGLLDLLVGALLADRLPKRRALIGIQPDNLDWGDAPTPAVAAAIPQACEHALELMARWQS